MIVLFAVFLSVFCVAVLAGAAPSPGAGPSATGAGPLLVVGSVNADVIVPLSRLPVDGETVVAEDRPPELTAGKTVAGGKGANQAVAAKRLGARSTFLCQFGGDGNGEMLKKTLEDEGVDVGLCERVADLPSGMGLVLLVGEGSTCIVCSGSNGQWDLKNLEENILPKLLATKPSGVLLQMEVPQEVNELVAKVASSAGLRVFQDVGGADRPFSDEHLKNCAIVSPNLSELRRLTKLPCEGEAGVLDAARSLQARGARSVLVTLGSEGSLLLTEAGDVLKQKALPAEPRVVDETGAGDNFRAAFCTKHWAEGCGLAESLQFAAAAAAVSVTKLGAIPACCRRHEAEALLLKHKLTINGGSTSSSSSSSGGNWWRRLFGGPKATPGAPERSAAASAPDDAEDDCPFKFASRLNSMSARLDLFEDAPFGLAGGGPVDGLGTGVRAWIRRQGLIKGLSLVDFNYPQHLTKPPTPESRAAVLSSLSAANLSTGAVCLRFPKADFQLGALTHPDPATRAKALQLCADACEWAATLNSQEVVIWSAFCGYDYPLQADYDAMWADLVASLQQLCDRYPRIKISLEFKPTDENTRYFAVPSTGAAVLLERQVARKNFGLTLDFGHCLMAGENPAQSVAMVAQGCSAPGKLFGVQLGDGHSRLGAEDGLVFGSVHRLAALEFVYHLCKTGFAGHVYFDTFPRNEDPVREAEMNVRVFKRMWVAARRMLRQDRDKARVDELMRKHDALGMLDYTTRSGL